MENTSLYKARIYIVTNNNHTYIWNEGTNWKASTVVDTNIKTKLMNKGVNFDHRSTDKEKHYFFTGLNPVVVSSTGDLTSTDFANLKATSTFTITAAGTSTKLYWDNLVSTGARTFAFDANILTLTKIEDIINYLNNMLGKTIGCVVGGTQIMLDHYYEFFRFDNNKIGFKTKEFYSSGLTNEFQFTLTDGTLTPLAYLKLPTGLTSFYKSKCLEDYEELQTILTSGNNIDLYAYNFSTEQPSYQLVKINGNNISEGYINIIKLPEVFNQKGV